MIELLTPAEMAEADRLAIAAGISGIELMENAGRAVADAAARLLSAWRTTGAGGGRSRQQRRRRICHGADPRRSRVYGSCVCCWANGAKLKGDAAIAAGRWQGPVEAASPDGLAGAGFVIDALFGAGLDRPVEGQARAMIEAMNASGAPILAVDLPSGIRREQAEGCWQKRSERREQSRSSAEKPGHILLPGRLHCGPVDVADIGIPDNVLEEVRPRVFANVPSLWAGTFPFPRIDGHKYKRGHAVVVSGGLASTGAARLAARGALRAGAGLVTIASPAEALAVNAAANLSIMVRQVDDSGGPFGAARDRRITAVVLGPGGGVGPRLREMVLAALAIGMRGGPRCRRADQLCG